jgi:hypothetical protein
MVTRSPRRICVKLGDRFDAFQRVALAIQVKTGDLLRHPSSRRPRAGVGHYETQLAPRPRARRRCRIIFILSAGADAAGRANHHAVSIVIAVAPAPDQSWPRRP